MTGFEWVGADGLVWDLASGPVFLAPGVQGLSMLESDQFVKQSPALHGQWLTGWRGKPRQLFLPLTIQPGTASWLAVSRALWAGLRPDATGTFTVTADDGRARYIQCRFVDDGSQAYDADPFLFQREVLGVNMVADDPWWYGPDLTRSFSAASAPVPFFATSGGVLNLMSSFTTSTASIPNPGDVPAWPKWTVSGPLTGFSLGVGSAVVSATMTLGAGDSLTIDTAPTAQLARRSDGSLVPLSSFSSIGYAQVPPGSEVPLSVTLVGGGTVSVVVSPRYYRAW